MLVRAFLEATSIFQIFLQLPETDSGTGQGSGQGSGESQVEAFLTCQAAPHVSLAQRSSCLPSSSLCSKPPP